MAITLYGHKMSLCTRRVLVVMAEKGLDLELEKVDFLTGEHKRPPYIEKHPFGVIPLLEDGSFTIFESRAIARYLAAKYQGQGTKLVPENGDLTAWGTFEQWASIEYSLFHVRAEQVLVQKLFNPSKGIATDEEAATAAVARLRETMDVLENTLGRQNYMGGAEFTLIDTFYLPTVDYLHYAGEGLSQEKYPNLHAWWERVTARDSWKRVTAFTSG
ncbi:putative glutathion S-transferase II, GST-II [Aaosphaeria arxii CBS 175.79]|uniref:glutathione transferase n=1 Tax=Aaosphaeria arxii CBS 175.79 TaxID=1450172 RepID=A0A6A5XQ68_9PLEO|nr:putative glutathion S-transferase II, GST-II [Aaosphaeria arxii CBS 175.79]KAF2015408.1 putative glutathion S-transferase II, GST-II [Aaosphaeria arxii CBS 175.79]